MRTTVAVAVACVGLSGCRLPQDRAASEPHMTVTGESLVLAGSAAGNLCFDRIVPGSLVLRSTFVPDRPETVVYVEGRDYAVDYVAGTVSRTDASRIPDFATHCLYGLDDFDHTKFPDFSNHKWFVWADYETLGGRRWAEPADGTEPLRRVREKLEAGGPFLIASYGDSITAGGEASEIRFRFQERYADYLRARFPSAVIEVRDVSIPGYSSRHGIDWFDKYLGTVENPDLVLLGFGMNDHNIGDTEPEGFQRNLVTLVGMIRERKGADVLLFSAFPPNDRWHYGTHRMGLYAAATEAAARETGCAYVDVYATWQMVLERKDQSSLLGNNINHPNDFGHWLYEQAFEALRF